MEVRQLMFLVLWLCNGVLWGMLLFHVCGDGRGVLTSGKFSKSLSNWHFLLFINSSCDVCGMCV